MLCQSQAWDSVAAVPYYLPVHVLDLLYSFMNGQIDLWIGIVRRWLQEPHCCSEPALLVLMQQSYARSASIHATRCRKHCAATTSSRSRCPRHVNIQCIVCLVCTAHNVATSLYPSVPTLCCIVYHSRSPYQRLACRA